MRLRDRLSSPSPGQIIPLMMELDKNSNIVCIDKVPSIEQWGNPKLMDWDKVKEQKTRF